MNINLIVRVDNGYAIIYRFRLQNWTKKAETKRVLMEIKSITTIAEGTFYIKVFYKSEIDDIMEWKKTRRAHLHVCQGQTNAPAAYGWIHRQGGPRRGGASSLICESEIVKEV